MHAYGALLARAPVRAPIRRRCSHLKAGEPLFLAGDAGDGCYRLERGLLKIVITSARGEERILATLGPGEIAGELAIIDGQPRSASVFAVRDCELSFISRKDFEECTRQQLRAPVPLHTMTSAVPLRHNSGIKVN
jgi:CRP-like cAMP-binding protein